MLAMVGGGNKWQHPYPRHVLRAVGWPKGDGGAPPPMVGRRFRCPRLHRENFSVQSLDVSSGDELRAAAVNDVQLLAMLVAPELGVGLVVEALKVLIWGLVPQSFSAVAGRSHP
jgi:hypothetical protein